MTLTGALSAALSGLTANSRAASVVSANIANASTEGYGVRSINTSAITHGAGYGVRVDGVDRYVDPVLLGERREAEASYGDSGTRTTYLARVEDLIGLPENAGSLGSTMSDFEAQLISAVSRPDSQARLEGVYLSASRLADKVNDVSDGIQSMRLEADKEIGTQIENLNRTIAEIHDLNVTIRTSVSRGDEALGLIDKQQSLIDDISALVPIREVRSDSGTVNLYTATGLSLLDGLPAEFGFTTSAAITPNMTYEDGDLSGLTVNGRTVTIDGSQSVIAGGTLAGLFAVRDQILVTAQSQIDGVALDLTARLDDTALDTSHTATQPGLFTDAGALSSASYETGLASRLRINAAVDPEQGGETWRLRDGVGAAVEGNPGDPSLLQGILTAIQDERISVSSAYSATSRSMSELSSDFLSLTAIDRQFADTDFAQASGQYQALREAELRGGVDTDQQMQNLLEIENAYAANARVISAIEEMMDQIMRF